MGIYAGHQVVRAYNGEKQAEMVFDNINENLYDSAWKSQFLSGRNITGKSCLFQNFRQFRFGNMAGKLTKINAVSFYCLWT